MKKRKYVACLLIALCISHQAHTVSASSPYDTSYQTVSAVTIGSNLYGGCTNTDITSSWQSYILDSSKWRSGTNLTSVANSLRAALNDTSNGQWGVTQQITKNGSEITKSAIIFWSQDPAAHFDWTTHSGWVGFTGSSSISRVSIACSGWFYGDSNPNPVVIDYSLNTNGFPLISSSPAGYGPWVDIRYYNLFSYNVNANLPTGYEGLSIVNGAVDADGDGLVLGRESAQGTSDNNSDSDGDGLSDLIESQWYSNRDAVFCGAQCAYPDPLKKDVYIELDWMNDSANSRLLKPSGAQLTYVLDMFDDKNINLHIDTGQYGGGNVLPVYAYGLRTEATPGATDFGDFKDGGDGIAANFAANRHSIWKYMIYGYGYTRSDDPNYPGRSDSSGLAEVSGDDIFVAGGLVEDMSGLASLDRAVANTIAHEIGHTLCLSSSQLYQEQNVNCVYNAIDNDSYKPENYLSVMNYRYQLTDDDDMGVVNYSNGANGMSDHDDWSGVLAGMRDFNGTQTQLGSKRVFAKNKTMDPDKIVQEVLPVKVKTDNSNDKQAALSLLASIHPPSGLSQPKQTRSSGDESAPSKERVDEFNWTMVSVGSVMALGAVGASTWYFWRKR